MGFRERMSDKSNQFADLLKANPSDATGNTGNASSNGDSNTDSGSKPTSDAAPVEDTSNNAVGDTRPQAANTDSVSGTMMRAVDEPQTAQATDKREPQVSETELARKAVDNFARAAGISLTDAELGNLQLSALGGGNVSMKVAESAPKVLGNERMMGIDPAVLAMARDAAQGAAKAGVVSGQEFKLETGVNFETQLANRGQQQSGGLEIANA
jgi:hypothetical protein